MNRFDDIDVNKADLNTKSMYVHDQWMAMTMDDEMTMNDIEALTGRLGFNLI